METKNVKAFKDTRTAKLSLLESHLWGKTSLKPISRQWKRLSMSLTWLKSTIRGPTQLLLSKRYAGHVGATCWKGLVPSLKHNSPRVASKKSHESWPTSFSKLRPPRRFSVGRPPPSSQRVPLSPTFVTLHREPAKRAIITRSNTILQQTRTLIRIQISKRRSRLRNWSQKPQHLFNRWPRSQKSLPSPSAVKMPKLGRWKLMKQQTSRNKRLNSKTFCVSSNKNLRAKIAHMFFPMPRKIQLVVWTLRISSSKHCCKRQKKNQKNKD